MKTLKQEIRELKMGYEKIFKIDYENYYIIANKSKANGLKIYFFDEWEDETRSATYEEIPNNYTEFSLYEHQKLI